MPDIDETNIPRYVIFRKKKARVLGYENGWFMILDHNDSRYRVPRSRITFIKGGK